MGKTHAVRERERSRRLAKLPKAERLRVAATAKKMEGRVLNAAEKHAVKMTGEYGAIMQLWEELRTEPTHDGTAQREKTVVVADLWTLIKPQFEVAARSPGISRVIQSCVKYGSNDQVENVLSEVSKDFVASATGPYSHFVVCALLRHATHELHRKLLSLVLTHMSALVSQKFGAYVIHTCYSAKMTTAADRNLLVLGVFKDSVTVMKQWQGYPELEQILLQETAHRKRLVTALFALLDKLVSQKEAYGYPFVERLLCAFFRFGPKHEIQELADSLAPHLGLICEAKEGAILAAQVVAALPPPRRKAALIAFNSSPEGGLLSLCLGKHSAAVVARLCDLVYDPQLLWKYVTGHIAENMAAVLGSAYGHMILLHLLTPDGERKSRALLPYFISDFNLFSRQNASWNTVRWFAEADARTEPSETVEVICPTPAVKTHSAAIRQLLPPFARCLASLDSEGPSRGEHKAKGGAELHATRVVKEVLHLLTDPEYSPTVKAALAECGEGALELFERSAPKKNTRAEAEEAPVAEQPPSKKARQERANPPPKTSGNEVESTPAATTPSPAGRRRTKQ